jgi:hypothetical protein
MFEKKTNMTNEEVYILPGMKALNWHYENNWWIYSENMNVEEKKAHPEHETTGGYLKSIPFKDACTLMWSNMSDAEKKNVLALPNFNAAIFEKVTGIKVEG